MAVEDVLRNLHTMKSCWTPLTFKMCAPHNEVKQFWKDIRMIK